MRLPCLAIAAVALATGASAPAVREIRMTPIEVVSGDKGSSQIGSSKLAGVHTKVLAGDPASAGFYSILLFVPPRTSPAEPARRA